MDRAELVTAEVNDLGCALLPRLLAPAEAGRIAGLYDEVDHFRATIDMARHRFGDGQYRYFDRPFPEAVEALRQTLYPRLLPIARDWYAGLGREAEWPDALDEWLDVCHLTRQTRPTPILLRYGAGDWNALHRDPPSATASPPSAPANATSSASSSTTRNRQPL